MVSNESLADFGSVYQSSSYRANDEDQRKRIVRLLAEVESHLTTTAPSDFSASQVELYNSLQTVIGVYRAKEGKRDKLPTL